MHLKRMYIIGVNNGSLWFFYTMDDLVNQLPIERKVMYTNASQKDVYNWCKQRFSIVLYTVDDLVNQLPIHLSLYI